MAMRQKQNERSFCKCRTASFHHDVVTNPTAKFTAMLALQHADYPLGFSQLETYYFYPWSSRLPV